jgi:hypothetical protein
MKELLKKAFGPVLFLFLVIGMLSGSSPQEKSRDKDKKCKAAGAAMTGESITVLRDKDAMTVIRSPSGASSEDDFLVEPKKNIRLRAEILELKPTETRLVSSPTVVTENGKEAVFIQGNREGSIHIKMIPFIVEGKGIDLTIGFTKEPEMKEEKKEKVFLQNGESAVMELYENKAKNSRLGLKITPFVEVVDPAREYSDKIHEVRLTDSFLFLNEDKLIARGELAVKSAEDDIYLFFLCDGKGLFVLSFKPFEGAEPKGVVKGKTLRIKFGGDTYDWLSQNPILPEGKWLVWVRHNPRLEKILIEKDQMGILGKNGMIGFGTGKDSWKKYFD